MNKNIETLLNLIKENPELRIVPMVDRDICQDDYYQYWLGSFGECAITKMYNDINNERVFLEDDIEDLVVKVINDYDGNLTNIGLLNYAEEIVNNYNWEKVIIVYIELP